MIGAIIGDIVGSRFQFEDFKSKKFDFFARGCVPTDDTFMTLAVGSALTIHTDRSDTEGLKRVVVQRMREIAHAHPDTGWGYNFYKFLFHDGVKTDSYGNGAGMRISAVGWIAETEEELKRLSKAVTEVSHNSKEGLLGAECVAMAVYLARNGVSKADIKARLIKDYYPELADMTLDKIRPTYGIDEQGEWVTCRGSIPHAMTAFFEGENFEDCIRGAISIGGDADTIACMTGAVAEAYFGVGYEMEETALEYLSDDLRQAYFAFESIKKKRVKRRV